MGGVEGKDFAAAGLAVAGFLNASDFVVDVIEDTASLVGALDQVAGFVVGVAAIEYGATIYKKMFQTTLISQPSETLCQRDQYYDLLIVSIHLFSNSHFSTSYKKLGLIFLSIGNCFSFFFMVSKKYR